MALSVNTKSYDLDSYRGSDIARYNGPVHSLSASDYIDVKRTAPKPTSTFAGVGKGSVKLTRNVTDGTDSLGNGILEISTSFPVGASATELQGMIDDLAAWLATAVADDVFISQDITH